MKTSKVCCNICKARFTLINLQSNLNGNIYKCAKCEQFKIKKQTMKNAFKIRLFLLVITFLGIAACGSAQSFTNDPKTMSYGTFPIVKIKN